MTVLEAIRQDIVDHPDDPTFALILADWMEERGSPFKASILRERCRVGTWMEVIDGLCVMALQLEKT